jgi:transposase InsO family protein
MVRRQKSKSVTARNQAILKRIEAIKRDHPAWGYRRVWAYLRYREGIEINKKRVYNLMKENRLLATQTRNNRAKRTPLRSKPRSVTPNKLWGTDMTKILVESWGWVYLHVVFDWGSKKIVGWHLSPRSKTEDWLEALSNAINAQFPQGVRESDGLRLVSDNGCQPTSVKYMAACRALEMKQIFTSYNNPKGNADTERVIRTIKEDLVWPREWTSFQQLQNALKQWVHAYNTDYPHSSINYQTPEQYEQNYLTQINTQLSKTFA